MRTNVFVEYSRTIYKIYIFDFNYTKYEWFFVFGQACLFETYLIINTKSQIMFMMGKYFFGATTLKFIIHNYGYYYFVMAQW